MMRSSVEVAQGSWHVIKEMKDLMIQGVKKKGKERKVGSEGKRAAEDSHLRAN